MTKQRGRQPNLTVLHASPPPKTKPPAAPTWMHKLAKAEWKRVAPILHNRKTLSADVLGTLASYCVASGQVREAEEIMMKEGRTYVADSGRIYNHPAFNMQAQALREARLYAIELGLTPNRKGRKAADETPGKGGKWDDELLA